MPDDLETSIARMIDAGMSQESILAALDADTPVPPSLMSHITGPLVAPSTIQGLGLSPRGSEFMASMTSPLSIGLTLGGAGLASKGLGAASKALPWLNSLRREMMLTGRAVPMNISTAVGGAGTAALERRSLKPLMEMLNVPKLAKGFKRGFTHPQIRAGRGLVSGQGPIGPVTRTIAGIDNAAAQALRRAGLSRKGIDRLLHTGLREPLFRKEGKTAQEVARLIFPFQTTPMNVVGSGAREIGELFKSSTPGIRRALTLASLPAGAGVGETAKRTAPRHPILTAFATPTALALAGPRMLPASIAALARARLSTPRANIPVGSLSPLPEFGLDPAFFKRSYGGFKPVGWALAQRTERASPARPARRRAQTRLRE